MPVSRFDGKYSFLSNFWPTEVLGPWQLTFPSVEHAYVAAKSIDPEFAAAVLAQANAGKIKKMGRKVKLRDDWETVKLSVMENLVRQKFRGPLGDKLKIIEGHIEEGNYWHDTFWGVDLASGVGHNHLGKILMKIRDELNAKEKEAEEASQNS